MATVLDIDCELRQVAHREQLIRESMAQAMIDLAELYRRRNVLLDQRKLAAIQERVTGRINQPQGPA